MLFIPRTMTVNMLVPINMDDGVHTTGLSTTVTHDVIRIAFRAS